MTDCIRCNREKTSAYPECEHCGQNDMEDIDICEQCGAFMPGDKCSECQHRPEEI